MGLYTDQVMDHFMNPRNVGEVPDPDGVGFESNPVCGDLMRITIKVDAGRIADAKFRTEGCTAAIAASSMATLMVIGRSLVEAEALSQEGIAAALGGLPPMKMHGCVLAVGAIHKALEDYRRRDVGLLSREGTR